MALGGAVDWAVVRVAQVASEEAVTVAREEAKVAKVAVSASALRAVAVMGMVVGQVAVLMVTVTGGAGWAPRVMEEAAAVAKVEVGFQVTAVHAAEVARWEVGVVRARRRQPMLESSQALLCLRPQATAKQKMEATKQSTPKILSSPCMVEGLLSARAGSSSKASSSTATETSGQWNFSSLPSVATAASG